MNVLVTLDPTLGISLGPNFTLSTDIGSVVPASATKSQLFAGISVIVNDLATVIQVISEGECTNILELPIIGASTTTTTSSTTTTTTTEYCIECGALYNGFVHIDPRRLTSSDNWHVSAQKALPDDPLSDWDILVGWTGTGFANGSTAELKEAGTTHWAIPNTGATNSYNFNARGCGYRWIDTFSNLDITANFGDGGYPYSWGGVTVMNYNDATMDHWGGYGNGIGLSIRLCNRNTLLSEGQYGTYIGNDLTVYRTKVINGIEWMIENLNEKKYRTGEWIHGYDGGVYTPIIGTWADSEGMCYYNDNISIGGNPGECTTTTSTSSSTTSTSSTTLTTSSTTTTTTTNISELGLRLTWDDVTNVPVADVNSVSDWNIFFDLPTNGSPFTSVDVDTNTVTLFGGSDIILKDSLFDDNVDTGTHLNSISDDASCVVEIGYDVFGDELNNGCYNLTYASFPIVTTIGDYAFVDCEGLITLDLPSCINLGVSCFSGGTNLTTILLPFNSFTELTEGIFGNCPLLTSLSFPNANIIGQYCFNGCSSLSTLVVDYSGITDITHGVFEGTAIPSFNFPNVLTVGEYSFGNNNAVTNIDLALVETIGNWAFTNCPLLDTISIPSCISLGDQCCVGDASLVNINASLLQDIGQSCFQNCSSLINIVFDNLLTMGDAVFGNCSSLITVSLPLVDSAGASAFNTCPNLQTVYIPSVLSVGAACFNACNSITDIDLSSCTNLGGSVLNNNVFAAISGQTINLTIPIGLMTCNGGLPDGDIQYLQVHNTVTIITV